VIATWTLKQVKRSRLFLLSKNWDLRRSYFVVFIVMVSIVFGKRRKSLEYKVSRGLLLFNKEHWRPL